MQRVMAVSDRRFVATCWSHLQIQEEMSNTFIWFHLKCPVTLLRNIILFASTFWYLSIRI